MNLFLETGRHGVHILSSYGKKTKRPTGRKRRKKVSNTIYDNITFGQNIPLNISPYLESSGHDQRLEFLDNLITSAISSFERFRVVPGTEHLDNAIVENLKLYFLAMTRKFWSPLRNKYDSWELPRDNLVVQSTEVELRRAMADFSIKKMTGIRTFVFESRLNKTHFLVKSQQELLRKIADAWVNETDPEKMRRYIGAIITATEIGNWPSAALRGANKDSASSEKIIQALEMCRDALLEEKDEGVRENLNSLIQTLSIGWIKSLKSPDELLGHIKATVAKPKKDRK
jgi:hypothetical protein